MNNGKLHPLIVSAFGVASAIAGALLGHYLSLQEKRVSLLEDARRQAYVDFLKAREMPGELSSGKAAEKDLQAEAARAEEKGDKKKFNGLRTRLEELHRKNAVINDQWAAESKSDVNRIAIYGDSGVVRVLASFFREDFPSNKCGGHWKLDIQIYQNMRRSLIPKEEPVSDRDLAELVLQCAASD